MTRVTTLPGPEEVAVHAASEIARLLEEGREQRGSAHVALSGGGTPARTYELLAQTLENWDAVEVWFADERCVAPEDERSNHRLAAETLLRPAGIPEQRIHRMLGELGPHEGARRYAEELRAHAGQARGPRSRAERSAQGTRGHGGGFAAEPNASGPIELEVAVLGIGPEGHVASLFPDAPALKAGDDELCVGVSDSPKPPPERITLTLPMLRAARHCLVIATGREKAGAISAMLGAPSERVPASLLPHERLSVIVDDAASGAPGAPWLTHRA
jgi:6-phosphogluconolactonase